jgi:ribosome-binding protein aMBF1 (putative translation factor)
MLGDLMDFAVSIGPDKCDECGKVKEGKFYYIKLNYEWTALCEDCFKKFKKMISEEEDVER